MPRKLGASLSARATRETNRARESDFGTRRSERLRGEYLTRMMSRTTNPERIARIGELAANSFRTAGMPANANLAMGKVRGARRRIQNAAAKGRIGGKAGGGGGGG